MGQGARVGATGHAEDVIEKGRRVLHHGRSRHGGIRRDKVQCADGRRRREPGCHASALLGEGQQRAILGLTRHVFALDDQVLGVGEARAVQGGRGMLSLGAADHGVQVRGDQPPHAVLIGLRDARVECALGEWARAAGRLQPL